MSFEIKVLDAQAIRMVEQSGPAISRMFEKLLRDGGRILRDKVRENIKTEGETFEDPWKELSKWVIAKKGSRKALAGMHEYVRYRTAAGRAEVYFDSPGDWSIDRHHRGFTESPTGDRVTLSLKRPSALTRKPNGGGAYRWPTFSFKSYRPSKVPRRRIWPTVEQTHKIIEPLTASFATELGREITR